MGRSGEAVLDFVWNLETKTNSTEIVQAFGGLAQEFGFGLFWLGTIERQASGQLGTGWGRSCKGWFDRYRERNYLEIDPTIRRVWRSRQPFRWSEVRRAQDTSGLQILDEITEFGFREGLTCGLPLQRETIAAATVATGERRISPADRTALDLAIQCSLVRAGKIARAGGESHRVSLSRAELECLKWLAAGKFDAEISDILVIPEAAVNAHVAAVLKKLNAPTRAHAVAAALTLKLVAIDTRLLGNPH
jgi:LuxR family quorum sensing-dependent transcriptional regulator